MNQKSGVQILHIELFSHTGKDYNRKLESLALVDRHDFHGTFSCARKIYFAIINFIFLQMFNISDKIK